MSNLFQLQLIYKLENKYVHKMKWLSVLNKFLQVFKIDSRTGLVLMVIEFPVQRVTSVTFGGANYDILFVTSSRFGLTEEQLKNQPAAGALFSVSNLNATGRHNNRRAANYLGCPPRQMRT